MFAWHATQEGLGMPSGWGYSSCRAWQFWQASPPWAWFFILSATSPWQEMQTWLSCAGLPAAPGWLPWAPAFVGTKTQAASNTKNVRNTFIVGLRKHFHLQSLPQAMDDGYCAVFTRPASRGFRYLLLPFGQSAHELHQVLDLVVSELAVVGRHLVLALFRGVDPCGIRAFCDLGIAKGFHSRFLPDRSIAAAVRCMAGGAFRFIKGARCILRRG